MAGVMVPQLGREVEFPDGMSPEQIAQAIERDILPNVPTAADHEPKLSVAGQARARLRSRGTSAEEQKSAAAAAPDVETVRANVVRELRAGGTPVDDSTIESVVEERMRKYRGGKQLYRDPTPAEATKAALIGAGVGLVEGIVQVGSMAIDAARIQSPLTNVSAVKRIGQGYGEGGWRGALGAAMPATAAVSRKADSVQADLKKGAGITDDVILDTGDATSRLIGNLAAPGPEVMLGGRAARALRRLRGEVPANLGAAAAEDVAASGVWLGEAAGSETAAAPRELKDVWNEYQTARREADEAQKFIAEAEQRLGRVVSPEEAADPHFMMRIRTEIGGEPEILSPSAQVKTWREAHAKWREVAERKDDLERELDAVAARDAGVPADDVRGQGFGGGNRAVPDNVTPIGEPASAPGTTGESGYDVSEPPSPPADGSGPPSAPTAAGAASPPAKPGEVGWWTKVREFVEDDWIRVKKLVEDPKTKVTEASDPYAAEIRFHGRLGTRIEEAEATVTRIDRDIVDTSKKLGLKDADLQRDVNDYLHARHAPERNAAIGDRAAGMSDDEARDVMTRIDSSPHAAEVKRIADDIQELNNRTLDTLLEAEVITQDLYDTLRTKYKNHVPLNRVMDEGEDFGNAISTRPLDVRSSGIRRAKGSQREVADITTNIVHNYQQALVRAEKNRVNLATLRFARDNPELGLFRESRPQAIGKRFDEKTMIMDRSPESDPRVLTVFEKGKPVYLHINDLALATALKGVNRLKVDGVFRYIGAYTRFSSSLATRWNPEFWLPNKVRDLQEATIYAFSKNEIGGRAALSIPLKDARSMKDVLDGLRGADTDGARLYQQMRRDGGTTGGMGLSTRKQLELDIEGIRRTNRSAPRLAGRQILQWVDGMNTVIEDSTRLSVYKAALERGLSRDRAAVLAKEASINFNKFGRGGPQVNALYMFANASVQGSAKMLRAMKNPKVALAVTSSTAAAVFSTARWNDHIDPRWREDGYVNAYDKTAALVVMLPPSSDGAANYLKIPVSWGLKPIKVAMDFAESALSGHASSPGDVVSGMAKATAEGFNPLGGTDVPSAITPSFADVANDLRANTAWHGGKIRPDKPRTPPSQDYFRSLAKSPTGETAIGASNMLSDQGIEVSPANLKYAYESLVGGAGRAATRMVNTVTSIGRGEAPDINEVPIMNRFIEQIPSDRIEAARRAIAREKNEKAVISAKIKAATEKRKAGGGS